MRWLNPILLCALFAVCHAGTAQAQPALDRIVGRDTLGAPLTITKLTPSTVGALAWAGRVPMGLEAVAPVNVQPWTVTATGRTLRAVLDEIVTADPRYEWREDNGVIVIRPVGAWADIGGVLHSGIGAVKLDDVEFKDALRVVARLFGADLGGADIRDPKRFSVDLPPGSMMEALDGIVRAHGAMAWALAPTVSVPRGRGSMPERPLTMFLMSGAFGWGFGVGAYPVVQAPLQLDRASTRLIPAGSPLDRIVGTKFNGQPLVVHAIASAFELGSVTGVPMGIELLPLKGPGVFLPETTVTGMPLRDALTMLTTADPRYEWREMKGVVVIRPVTAWTDPLHLLLRPVKNVKMDKVTMSEVIHVERSLLDPDEHPGRSTPSTSDDDRRVSVDLPHGTQLDLLNAIARSHGTLCWELETHDAGRRRFFGGRGHGLTFYIFGASGLGFAFP